MAQEASNVKPLKKPWYKTGWGISILIVAGLITLPLWIFLIPIAAIILIWKKTKWNQNVKIGATIGVVIIAGMIILSSSDSPKEISNTTDQANKASEAIVQKSESEQASDSQKEISNGTDQTNAAAEAPVQIPESNQVFDIPSLIGKNIDEIKLILGPVEQDTEPTKTQINVGITEWNKSWEKEGADLLVTYDVKTKKVVDFFISGVDPSGATKDKNLLLTAASVKEGQPEYDVKFVQVVKKPDEYIGVTIIPIDQKARALLIEQRANFDVKHGSDAFASQWALNLIKVAKDSGLEIDIYIKADVPADALERYLKGGDESDLRSNTKFAILNVVISNTAWAFLPESTKKDFVISLLTRVKEAYPNAVPRVKVSNGIREVAEGSFSVWSGDKVELK